MRGNNGNKRGIYRRKYKKIDHDDDDDDKAQAKNKPQKKGKGNKPKAEPVPAPVPAVVATTQPQVEDDLGEWKRRVASRPHATSGQPLTPRELEIASYMGSGLSNKQLCLKLGISANTLKNHLSTCYLKLGIDNRTQLAVWYYLNYEVKLTT